MARRKKRAQEKKKLGKLTEEKEEEGDPEITLVDMFTPHLVVRASGKIRSFDYGADEKTAKAEFQVI